jgi:hypothetical protein
MALSENKMKTTDELQALAKRLREMRGPADGRGAFLGDGMPRMPRVDIRAGDLADVIDELLALRATAAGAAPV